MSKKPRERLPTIVDRALFEATKLENAQKEEVLDAVRARLVDAEIAYLLEKNAHTKTLESLCETATKLETLSARSASYMTIHSSLEALFRSMVKQKILEADPQTPIVFYLADASGERCSSTIVLPLSEIRESDGSLSARLEFAFERDTTATQVHITFPEVFEASATNLVPPIPYSPSTSLAVEFSLS